MPTKSLQNTPQQSHNPPPRWPAIIAPGGPELRLSRFALIVTLFMNRLAPHRQLPLTTGSVTLSGDQTFFDAIRGIPGVPGK